MNKSKKELNAKLAILKDEIFAKAKEYNKLTRKFYTDEDGNTYSDDDDELGDDIIVVFRKSGSGWTDLEPAGADHWLPSDFC